MEISTMKLIEYVRLHRSEDVSPIIRIIAARELTEAEMDELNKALLD